MIKANTKLMKEINKNLIRNCFKSEIESTAANLSEKTGLSVVTVNGLLKEMINSKEIFVGESIPSNGGRPSTVYRYNDMFRCAAIVFGFTKNNVNHIRVIVTNLLGKCIYEKESNFENIQYDSFNDILDNLFYEYPTIEVISFGLPGVEEDGVIKVIDYPNIAGDNFLKNYKDRYKVPVIFINDINAAVMGYYNQNVDDSTPQTVVGIVFNRMHLPGAGIVINGDIYTGKANFAGEISYMPIDIDWLKINYSDSEEVSEAIGKLLAIISCVIAPDNFVIYSDFIDKDIAKKIKEKAKSMTKGNFNVNTIASNNFAEDYKMGMIKASLEVLYENEKVFE